MKSFSLYIVPSIFLIICIAGIVKKVSVYDTFLEGAKNGISIVFRLTPILIALILAVSALRASGALEVIIEVLAPIAHYVGIPKQILPLALLRPISGSASLALLSDMLKTYGPDSFIGKVASTIMGSTETIFYTLAVYLGAVGIKNSRYALTAALIADLISVIASVWICKLMFL